MSNQRYVQLPNGNTARVNGDGQIVVTFETDLSNVFEMAGNDLESWLAEMTTGEVDGLSKITFRIVGTSGPHGLTIEVAGTLADIEVEDLKEDELPMQEFEVQVTRVSYGSRPTRLSARTLDEARDIADDDAGNHTYTEHHSEYLIEAHPVQ
ncbi:hypothetical protein P3T23_008070 [Paraburkholderia sp. GAS448]|uniref:hypothetical protein n=1 Tax=Paraburkholderia sp. GAS448 TaxID=3035136 RepID=UPI003D21FEB6